MTPALFESIKVRLSMWKHHTARQHQGDQRALVREVERLLKENAWLKYQIGRLQRGKDTL